MSSKEPFKRGHQNPKFDDNLQQNARFFEFSSFLNSCLEAAPKRSMQRIKLEAGFRSGSRCRREAATMQQGRRGADFDREFAGTPSKPNLPETTPDPQMRPQRPPKPSQTKPNKQASMRAKTVTCDTFAKQASKQSKAKQSKAKQSKAKQRKQSKQTSK